MDLQTLLTYLIVALAALYAGRQIWRQFFVPEDTPGSCGCASKQGCAALHQNMSQLMRDLEVLTQK